MVRNLIGCSRNVQQSPSRKRGIEASKRGVPNRSVPGNQHGIAQEHAKKINQLIRDSKLKVRSQVEGEKLRVFGKSRDDLQEVMKLLNGADLPIPLQYTNYR